MGEEEQTVLGVIARKSWLVVICVFTLIFSGFITMKLWNGLISPVFHLTTLTVWQALGLDLFIRYLTASPNSEKNKKSAGELLITALTTKLIFWGIGSFIMLFI